MITGNDLNKGLENPQKKISDPSTTKTKLIKDIDLYSGIDPRNFSFGEQQFVGQTQIGKSEFDRDITPTEIQTLGLDYIRASQQTGREKATRAIGGGLYKGVLTAVEDAGYLLDVENNMNRVMGLENVDSNWMSDLAKGAKESFDENHPIYRYNPEKVIDFNDPGFYWTALQGVIDSAVGFGAIGVGAGATVGRGLKAMTKLTQATLPIQNMVATAGTALTTNYAEGKMMALELFTGTVDSRMKEYDKNAFDKAFNQIQSLNPTSDPNQVSLAAQELMNTSEYQQQRIAAEKEIRSLAGQEADTFQKRNMIFMATDAIAINGMFKGVGSTRNLLKDKSIKNTALMIAKQAPTEYVEEVGQSILQKEGEYQALKNAGVDSEISSDMLARTWGFFIDPQTQLEGAMGLFGGPVQHVLVQAPTKLASRGSDQAYREQQTKQIKENEQLLNGLVAKQTQTEKAKQEAIKNGDIESFKLIVNDDFTDMAYRNFTSGSTENLENHLKEVAAMSPDEAQENGFEETYQEDAQARLLQLQNLEKTYLKIVNKHTGEKDYLVHKKLYDLETKRAAITPIIADLKSQKEVILSNISREVQTLEDVNISSDQMKLKNIELQLNSAIKTKARLTATKNEALIKPNKRFENKVNELAEKTRTLVIANKNKYKYTQEELINRNNEIVALQEEVNRLSQFTDEKTQNKRTVERVNKAHDKQAKAIDTQINQLTKQRDSVKETLKSNGEKINAFNNKDYTAWEEAVEVQDKINTFSIGKKILDDNYNAVVNNKDEYIENVEKDIKEAQTTSKQKDVDNEPTLEGKKEIINTEEDPEVQEQLKKNNQKDIQDKERQNRENNSKNNPTATTNQKEEVKTTQDINDVVNDDIIDVDNIDDVKEEVSTVQDDIRDLNSDIINTDEQGNEYSPLLVEKGFNLLAHLSRLYNKVVNGNKVSKEDVDNELNQESFIKLLNPDKYNTGTKITLQVTQDENVIINAETGETWKDFVEANNITDVASDMYINNVPIVVLDEDKSVIGYLHQDSWISKENIFGKVPENKKKLNTIRKKIVKDGKFDTTIKSKSIGYFFRNTEGLKKVSEAIPDQNIVYAVGGRDELFADQNLDNLNITNKDRIKSGYTYMIIQVGKDVNGKLYTAMPLINTQLGKSDRFVQIRDTITNSIRIYYKLARKEELTNDERTVYNTLGSHGFDIGTSTGLTEYVNQFVQVYFNKGKSLKEDVKNKYETPSTKTFLSIDVQQIQYYRGGLSGFINPLNTNSEQLEKALRIIGTQVLPFMYTNTDKQSIKNPNKAVKVINTEDDKLATVDLFDDYIEYVKENTQTDILGKKVDEVDGQDVYTYTIQPKVEIDFDKIAPEGIPFLITKDQRQQLLDLGYSKEDIAKMTPEGAQNTILLGVTKPKEEIIDIDIKKSDIEDKRFHELNDVYKRPEVGFLKGVKRDEKIKQLIKEINAKYDAELIALKEEGKVDEEGYNTLEDDSFSPDEDGFNFPDVAFLSAVEEEVIVAFQQIAANIILPNLDINKQSAIVDILFKDAITEITTNPNKIINVNTIYDQTFNEIESNLEIRNKNITKLTKNIEKATKKKDTVKVEEFESKLQFNKAIAALYESYLLNKEALIGLTNNQLNADNIVKLVGLDEDGNLKDSGEEQSEKTFDKSSYEIDKSDKMSRSIKRFLSGIRAYNADGTIQKNMLGRDKLMNYEEVYRQLQVVTANKIPDYDTLVATIKDKSEIFPFFKDVLTKLENEKNPDIEFIRNQLTVLLSNHYANSKFIMFRENNNGSYSLNINDSNSNSVDAAIREGWVSLFNQSDLVDARENGSLVISEKEANRLIAKYEKWKKNTPTEATPEVKDWLRSLGIVLDSKTWTVLEEGKFRKGKKVFSWTDQFKSGIFNLLATQYLAKVKGLNALDFLPTNEGIVNDLSRLDGKYSLNFHSNSQREGVKTVYSYNSNKLVTDTTRDYKLLNESKNNDGNVVYTNTLMTDKLDVIFNQSSSWLREMVKTDEFGGILLAKNGEVIVNMDSSMYQNLGFFTMSLEALKKQGTSSRDNRDLGKLSAGEIELVKLGLLTGKTKDKAGNNERIINLLYPTTSDKTTVMGLTVKATDITYDFETGEIDQNAVDMLYNQLVLPEIERILLIEDLEASNKEINLESNYTIGSKKFLFLSELNNEKYGLFNEDSSLNSNIQTDLKGVINDVIKIYINQLTIEKVDNWIDAGIVEDSETNVYIDSNFYNGFKKVGNENKIKAIATDMVIQYLVGNANTFQTYIGDPALFYKKNAKETYINIGKRLSSDIAPREQGNGSATNTYRQGFVKDRKVKSLVADTLRKILGDNADAYNEITSTDAQEYVTLLEDLYIKNMHGKIELKGLYGKVHDIVTKELSKKTPNFNYMANLKVKLTKEEWEYLRNITLQPAKPVYAKNIIDKELGIERRLYIKSSQFALSPFLTEGTELDKIRIAMEKSGTSRLAYDSAVKLGNVAESAEMWDENGNVVENLTFDDTNTLMIPRSGFGIQQEVPYDPLKEAINKVSQASKNLFVNMLDIDGFKVDWLNKGKAVKGSELNREYIKLYRQLFENQETKLFKELDYNPETDELDIVKLRDILKEEAIKRNYPIADLQSFDLDNELRFLAFSPSSQKFESLLNSIVTNRVIKMKFPGKSYVLGSEEGFKTKTVEDLDLTKMSITFTSTWKGSLQAADGSGRPDQVIMPWDFQDDINNYIVDGIIDTSKLPKELLERFGMRIPNQGPNSQAYIEVVGFLAADQGDLLIAPREFVVRMGSDFDVDKLYVYKYDYKKTNKGLEKKEDSIFNRILDVHLAIHKNTDIRIQRQIHSPLGFWELQDISTEIDNAITAKEEQNKLFTGLSDEYQKQKFINAAAGKALVGVFSNDSMFNALIQGKELAFAGTKKVPFKVTFGSLTSNGDLSNPYTLKTQRKLIKAVSKTTTLTSKDITQKEYLKIEEVNPYDYLDTDDITYKSEVISGYQSAAVDNEKEQILDKVNANSETSPVIKVMMMLGFGEEIPYFLSQDIIRDYVDEVKKLRGLGDFVANVEQLAFFNVANRDKYKIEYNPKEHAQYGNSKLTISKMKDMIKGDSVDNYKLTQQAIIDKYLDLKIRGRILGKVESSINLDSQGLGKSFFETLVREKEINFELPKSIHNLDKLVSGNTIPAMAIKYGLNNNNTLWKRFLPYDEPIIQRTFDFLETIFGKVDAGREARASFRNKMWNELKKYRYADPNLFTREKITDPTYLDTERKRLFINTTENKAIAKIVQDMKKTFPNNRFIQTLDTSIKKNGLPSIIKFRASTKEWSNETKIYEGFVDLLINEQNLGENGTELAAQGKENYTSRDLFQDLIWGAYLNGGIQEAHQYIKYIPAGYLHLIPFAEDLKSWIDGINENDKFTIFEDAEVRLASMAIKQIVQNNPEQLPKVTTDDFEIVNGKIVYKGDNIGLNNESSLYMSKYDKDLPTGSKKFRLYERTGITKDSKGKYYPEYIELPVVGTSGREKVSEYNYLKEGYNQTVFGSKKEQKEKVIIKEGAKPPTYQSYQPKLKPPTTGAENTAKAIGLVDTHKNRKVSTPEVLKDVLTKINNNSTDAFNKIVAGSLLNSIDKFNFEKLFISLTKNLKTKWGSNAAGQYEKFPTGLKLLSFNTAIPSHEDQAQFEYTILHELTHALTKEFIDRPKNTEQKKIVKNLETLRSQLETYFKNSDEYKKEYEKFITGNKALSKDIHSAFYATLDLNEFVAMMFASPLAQKIANEVQVEDKSILDKFLENIIDILKSLGFDVKQGSVLESSLESIIKLMESENVVKEVTGDLFAGLQDVEEEKQPLFDDEGFMTGLEDVADLPEFIPSSKNIMKEFNELNSDGTPKKLAVTDDNAKVMLKRAQRINKGQPYYKATYDKAMVDSKKEFYRIYLTPRAELKDIEYLADLVPQNILEEVRKQCK